MGRRLIVAAALFIGVVAAPELVGTAQEKQQKEGHEGDKGAPSFEGLTDAQFVMKASASDLAEINLGNFAAERAASSQVKQFGQKMVNDHKKSSKELLTIVGNKQNLAPAKKMDAKHEAVLEKLVAIKGVEFDKAYMMHMVMDHKTAVGLFQHQAKNGKDEDLRAFAAKTLPVIQEHLRLAQQITQDLKGTTGKNKEQ